MSESTTALSTTACDQALQPLDCRIVVLTHYLPPYIARIHYYAAQQVRDYRILLSIEQEPNRQFDVNWEGLDVRLQKSLMVKRPWKHRAGFQDELYIHFPYDTIRQLRRIQPDVVFSYELGFRSLTSAAYCKLYRKKLALCVCVSEHTEQGRGVARNLLRRLLLKAADAVTYNGPSCREYLKRFQVPDEKLFYFPYATSDLVSFSGSLQRTEEHRYRLLCVGQLSQRKGVQQLLDGLIRYCRDRPQRSVEIDFVGSGPLEHPLLETPTPENLQVRFLGHLPYEDVRKAMEEAGVLVFPTLADEWGMVVNEAMQAGMPVLGSAYSQACTTLIHEGQTGWIYHPDVPEELFAKLDNLFATDQAKLLQMRLSAQERVREYTPQASADKALAMLKKLADQRQTAHSRGSLGM